MSIWCFRCCLSEEEKIHRRINNEIEIQLRKDKLKVRQEVKLLLLGTGESGKTTFIKQMRIINGQGFSDADRREFVADVHLCIIICIKRIVDAMQLLRLPYHEPANEANALRVKSIDVHPNWRLTDEHVTIIKQLWSDANVRQCFNRRREYQLPDSASYYFNEIDRIGAAGPRYLPTDQDILRIRTLPTTGINEYTFEDRVLFRIVDVGGQRSERRKWIHCFQDVTSVIFVAALSEYDQVLLETDLVNRMEESIALFQTIASYYGKTSRSRKTCLT